MFHGNSFENEYISRTQTVRIHSSVEVDFTRQLDDRGMILLLKRRDSFIVIKEAIDYRNQVHLS